MKRLLCVLSLVVFLFPSVSAFSEEFPFYLSSHYSLFISGASNKVTAKGQLFSFDSFSADLYILEGMKKGYLCTTKCFSDIFITSGMVSVSIAESDGVLYFADENGNHITARYDENGSDLWVDMEGSTFRMVPVHEFSSYTDWK